MAVKSSKTKTEGKTLTLCPNCDKCDSCPVVENLDGTIAITDDDNDTITMTTDQFKVLIARGDEII